uniref:Tryptophan synthase beta chain-like PALP domain-containing protein n=1 Tax=Leptocylindrus danicus TaxID=163516 RepID=A0A7S2KQU6_9STRA|mmetsp:Transcript_25571/g.38178  ORF Transcript_25571/g.38178 Transcript_25571/m.38178 type:complete len:518 (+) Transcript_25571:98-1651(+)|eukprot:CAMPEP_0116033764 /NCGR_PEP_ID=MMETSP0321-20121206/19191_1 /TAXON_ID=163516 /ORGANISM="Leptocylindrus danicus var. danicus, Strain B650" /LENGTH=517 /DNA_ID=CAMNT_0003509917 /DNA_START=50 /DNA_END=1603 /DNA_ORIENTATION=-
MIYTARSINTVSRKGVAALKNKPLWNWTNNMRTVTLFSSPAALAQQMFFATLPTDIDSDNDDNTTSNNKVEDTTKPNSEDKRNKATNTKFRKSSPLDSLPVTFADISRAQVAIRDGIKRTTCEKSFFLSELIGSNVYLKTENQQFTGSFKERGARNAILSLITGEGGEEFKEHSGCIAASAGNHALAMAYHGKELGVNVTVVMPTVAPLAKVDKCKRFGARVIIHGAHIGEAKEYAETLVEKEGLAYVNGYDDPPILAGAGTMGIEIVDQVPDLDIVVVPVGGAGLIAGLACAIKTLKPDAKIIGVEPEFCPSYINALKAGKPVVTETTPTLADGLAVPLVGSHAFEVARHYVDECVTTTEKEIAIAVLRLIENEKMVVEGGGASGLAALLPGGKLDRADLKGKNIVVPLCGGNIDTTVLGRVMDRGMAADHRLVRFTTTVSDRAGGIANFTKILAEVGASIKDIYHERAWLFTSVDQTQIKVVCELQGKEHAVRVKNALCSAGYKLQWLEMQDTKT